MTRATFRLMAASAPMRPPPWGLRAARSSLSLRRRSAPGPFGFQWLLQPVRLSGHGSPYERHIGTRAAALGSSRKACKPLRKSSIPTRVDDFSDIPYLTYGASSPAGCRYWICKLPWESIIIVVTHLATNLRIGGMTSPEGRLLPQSRTLGKRNSWCFKDYRSALSGVLISAFC